MPRFCLGKKQRRMLFILFYLTSVPARKQETKPVFFCGKAGRNARKDKFSAQRQARDCKKQAILVY